MQGIFDCCEGLLSILHLLNINSMFTECVCYKCNHIFLLKLA